MVDPDRLGAAYDTARCDLLAELAPAGHWIGRLSSSPLATAAAASALALVERHVLTRGEWIVDERRQCALSELIVASLRWLARHQNADGGWGDSDSGPSNLAATMLARAAFALTCVPADHPGLLERADRYIESQGAARGLKRRYMNDKTFAASVLANCAVAGLIPWSQVPPLAFELAALPASASKMLRLGVARWELPALVAVGQARWFHYKPRNPLAYVVRGAALQRSLAAVEKLQAEDGGFFESTALAALVVTALAASGRAEHPIVRKGVEFLLRTVRGDGSWPITPNLATRTTALAVSALSAAGEDPRDLKCLDWLLASQQRSVQAQTGAISGGWASTDRPGAMVDVLSTAGSLLALWGWWRAEVGRESILPAATAAVRWLLDAQNADGGWPMIGPKGTPSFGESGSELTAQALRALATWRSAVAQNEQLSQQAREELGARIGGAIEAGLRYLASAQQPAGGWVPRWFGNPFRTDEQNPVLGTALVVASLRELERLDGPQAGRALDWLAFVQQADGSWGDGAARDAAKPERQGSVEATSLAVESLLTCGRSPAHETAALKGVAWLVDAVEANRHQDAAPIGLWLGRVGYYERLYPMALVVSTLGQAARRLLPAAAGRAVAHAAKIGR